MARRPGQDRPGSWHHAINRGRANGPSSRTGPTFGSLYRESCEKLGPPDCTVVGRALRDKGRAHG